MTSLAMSREEREAFLADLHVGVLSIPEPGRGPLTVPIWYDYQPGGELRFVTDRDSRKGVLLAKESRVNFLVQTESLPYKYVSVEGPITGISPADIDRDLRPIARRYLGTEGGDGYIAATQPERESREQILVRMQPERWLTVDYTKQSQA